MNKYCNIYNVTSVPNKSSANIKYINTIDTSKEEIRDTFIESFEILKKVHGELYACNITNYFLEKNKKLPVLYINVVYELSALRKVLIYRLYLFFTLSNTNEIKKYEDLLKNDINGKFSLEVMIDNKKTDVDAEIDSFIDIEHTKKMICNFTKEPGMIDICQERMKYIESQLIKILGPEMDQYKELPKATIKRK